MHSCLHRGDRCRDSLKEAIFENHSMLPMYPFILDTDPFCVSRAELSRNEMNKPVFNGSLMDVECIELNKL